MKLFNHATGIFLEHQGVFYAVPGPWDKLVNRKGLWNYLEQLLTSLSPVREFDASLPMLPPIGKQEVWAAGVTYFRSKEARMEESKEAGGGSFYDRVYQADRPELFFKSVAERVADHQGEVRIRRDSTWDVPEPELTLFISAAGTIEGYTIGNDMSSRSIEGENPLYLPQAKTYQYSASLGPCLVVTNPGRLPLDDPHKDWSGKSGIQRTMRIALEIHRHGAMIFDQSTTLEQMKRSPGELAGWLFRETDFPHGVYLMTGTGIVPPDGFTLQSGDEIRINIGEADTLINHVVKKQAGAGGSW